MKETIPEDIDIPWWQKLLLFAGMGALFFLVIFIWSLFPHDPPEQVYNCDNRFNPASDCPDPQDEYDQQAIEDSKRYPDDSY